MAIYKDVEPLEIVTYQGENEDFDRGVKFILEKLDALPTADVEEVVRCKDCDKPNNDWIGCPYIEHLTPPPNHYCSYGERRDT